MSAARLASRIRRKGSLARRRVRSSEPILIVLCAPLGALVGLIVVGLHELVSWLHVMIFALPPGATLSAGVGIDLQRLALVPVLGGLILSLLSLSARHFQSREIIDPVEANAIYGGRMSLIGSIRLAIAAIVSNAAGASLGMEAAYSQMGSGLLSSIGQWLRLRRADLRVFVGAGAAAAIAAAFNAPLAGAFYAYELVLGSYAPAALAQVATAAVAATLVVRGTIGVAPIFLVQPPALQVQGWEYPLFCLLGVAAAGIGIATMRAATGFERSLSRLRLPRWLHPVLGGVLLSCIALSFPQVLGSGHGAIQALFKHTPELVPIALLLLAKIAASAVSIGAGFRGGLFSSSLYIGCMFGAVVWHGLGLFVPWTAMHQMVFMLVGMGAVASAIVGAPMTMLLLALEVTGDFQIALAVLAGVVTAAAVTRYTFGYSFATWRFHQQGKSIRGAHDVGWIRDLTVQRVMRRDPKIVRQDVPLLQLRERFPLGSEGRVFVVDIEGEYTGSIDLAIAHDPDLDPAAEGLVAADLANTANVFLLPAMDIRTALVRFDSREIETMPVLASQASRRVIGYLTEAYALRRYTLELERRRSAELGDPDLFTGSPREEA